MHSAPSNAERLLYVRQNRWPFYILGVLSFLFVTAGMILFLRVSPWFLFFLPLVVLQVVYIGLSYYIGIRGKDFVFEELHLNNYIDLHHDFKPKVDVFLPVCGEPLDLIANTFKHVKAIDYPNHSVWVLDDAENPDVEILATSHGFGYMTRTVKRLKKAGNLRSAFVRTSGDLILILDADFCPHPRILRELVPYMRDERVAIVQSPQYFSVDSDMPWVQKGASYVQELFYRLIQVSRNTFGASVCVGTCALYRRSSLAPFGGTYPIDYSEDLHTGFQVLANGDTIRYTPVIMAKGVCPDTQPAFFRQQYRWAVGSISLFLNPWFWKAKVTLHQRLCYLTGMLYYVSTGLSVIFAPLPGILIIWLFPERLFLWNAVYAIPSLLFGTLFMAHWSRHRWGFYAPMSRQISFVAHLTALVERVCGRVREWVPSGAAAGQWPRPLLLARLWNYIVYSVFMGGIIWNYGEIHTGHWILSFVLASYSFILNEVALGPAP